MAAYYPSDVKYARVNATADGDNVVVAAVAGKALRVVGYQLTTSAAGTITVQDTASAVFASFAMAANGSLSYEGGLQAPAFETAVGVGLEISNGAGVDTLGHLAYLEV